jgi:hypothetical protein
MPYNATVNTLKKAIGQRLQIDDRSLLLVFMERLLEDRFTLEYYNIVPWSWISCRIGALPPGMFRLALMRNNSTMVINTVDGNFSWTAVLGLFQKWPRRHSMIIDKNTGRAFRPGDMVQDIARHTGATFALYNVDSDPIAVIDRVDSDGFCMSFVIELDECETVLSLKIKIRELLKIPVARQILAWAHGPEWIDQDGLPRNIHRTNCQTIILRERARSGKCLTVKADNLILTPGIENEDQLVSDLKLEVAEQLGIQRDHFQLLIPPCNFDDHMDQQIINLVISEYTRLLLVPHEKSVKIELNTEVGQLPMVLPLTATVAIVKEMIEVITDFQMPGHKLMFNGVFLQDQTAIVADIGLFDGSTIYVT